MKQVEMKCFILVNTAIFVYVAIFYSVAFHYCTFARHEPITLVFASKTPRVCNIPK